MAVRGTGKPCVVDGCSAPDRTRGYCENHYSKWRKWGPSLTPPSRPNRTCMVEGCDAAHSARGMCKHHYMRWWKYGDVNPDFDLDRDRCGTEASYFKRGCRCEDCRSAGRAARARWRDDLAGRSEVPHGVAGYVNYRCRCDACRAAWADYRRDGNRMRRLSSVQGQPYTARDVMDKGNWVCALCGEDIDPGARRPDPYSASVDHIVPLSKGGLDCATNVQASHLICNIRKGGRVADAG